MIKNKETFIKALLDAGIVSIQSTRAYTWASGIKSPIYTDIRKIYGHVELRNHVINGLISKIEPLQTNYVAGVATGAIGYGAIVADRLQLPHIYIRSSSKGHGLKRDVEGHDDLQNKSVVIIEDVVSTGGSLEKAKTAAEQAGLKILNAFCIFKYNGNADSLLSFDDLLEFGNFPGETQSLLREFRQELLSKA